VHIDPLDEELDNACLLGREQLVPDSGEVGEQDGDLALGNVFLAFRESMAGTASLRERLSAAHSDPATVWLRMRCRPP
jgi:hypothetical protein